MIATLIPCSRRAMFSKLNGLTCSLAPLLPATPSRSAARYDSLVLRVIILDIPVLLWLARRLLAPGVDPQWNGQWRFRGCQ